MGDIGSYSGVWVKASLDFIIKAVASVTSMLVVSMQALVGKTDIEAVGFGSETWALWIELASSSDEKGVQDGGSGFWGGMVDVGQDIGFYSDVWVKASLDFIFKNMASVTSMLVKHSLSSFYGWVSFKSDGQGPKMVDRVYGTQDRSMVKIRILLDVWVKARFWASLIK
ncbi:Zinc finger protein 177, partial [Manis javanica]